MLNNTLIQKMKVQQMHSTEAKWSENESRNLLANE
jgi:hypothetical protein